MRNQQADGWSSPREEQTSSRPATPAVVQGVVGGFAVAEVVDTWVAAGMSWAAESTVHLGRFAAAGWDGMAADVAGETDVADQPVESHLLVHWRQTDR